MDRVSGRQHPARPRGEGDQPHATPARTPGAADLRPDTHSTCTGPHCNARIAWVLTEGGKRMPLDEEPSTDGNVILTRNTKGEIRARVLTGHDLPAQQTAWVPHHRTCVDSAEFRRRKAAAAPKCRAGCGFPLDPWLVANGWRYHIMCAPPTRAELEAARQAEAS